MTWTPQLPVSIITTFLLIFVIRKQRIKLLTKYERVSGHYGYSIIDNYHPVYRLEHSIRVCRSGERTLSPSSPVASLTSFTACDIRILHRVIPLVVANVQQALADGDNSSSCWCTYCSAVTVTRLNARLPPVHRADNAVSSSANDK